MLHRRACHLCRSLGGGSFSHCRILVNHCAPGLRFGERRTTHPPFYLCNCTRAKNRAPTPKPKAVAVTWMLHLLQHVMIILVARRTFVRDVRQTRQWAVPILERSRARATASTCRSTSLAFRFRHLDPHRIVPSRRRLRSYTLTVGRAGLPRSRRNVHGNHDAVAAGGQHRAMPTTREFSACFSHASSSRLFAPNRARTATAAWRNPASAPHASDRWTRSGRARVTARHAPRPGCDLPTRGPRVPTSQASPSRRPIPKRTRNGCKPGSPSCSFR